MYLNTGVASGHGLDVEGRPHDVPVRPEALLGGPGPVALPSVGPHAELVLRVVVQVGEHCLLLRGLPQLLLGGTRALPELDLILGHLNS